MKNNKGQALVEFVLLLPIIMIVMFLVIDFATIFYDRNHLEGTINNISEMVKENISEERIKKAIDDKSVTYTVTYSDNMATIKMEKEVTLVTPFSSTFFKSGFKIKTERIILYEE